jgi:hypothetical protein
MYKTVLTGQRYHEIQPKVAHFLHALDQNAYVPKYMNLFAV